ncbi:hypothetical protein [Paenibacillus sp. GCM10027626]|uniref:hypothetical protein n=1 Tax=Paenibacillus sp. GCM10027626 TaxID=3273411 RepID=UPI00363EDD85
METKNAIPKGNAKRVAAIITEYRYNSHADVILGRLLGDFNYMPQVEVAAIYTDQVPDNDMSRAEAARCQIPIYPTISEAIVTPYQQGGLDGVVIIGEHGDYPDDEKGQKMYPRRRLLTETLDALEQCALTVPIFSDKHLSYCIDDSLWMFRQLRSRGIPFMGGSSIPHIPPVPSFDPALLQEAGELLVISFSNAIEAYGYHGLELMQSMAEQRRGGETGVQAVSVLQGDDVWEAMDAREWPEDLMLRALSCYPERQGAAHPRLSPEAPILFKVEYCDGFTGYVLQQDTIADQWGFAFRGDGGTITAAVSETDTDRPWKHFARLTAMIEQFIMTGREPFPAERILMSSGLINLAMEALYRKQRLETPELHIRY